MRPTPQAGQAGRHNSRLVVADSEHRVWSLTTANTSYVIHLTEDARLVQLYWGAALSPADVLLLPRRPCTTRPYSLPLDAQEQLPVDGGTRWGVPSLQVTFPGGVRSLELGFRADRVEDTGHGTRLDLVLADSHFPLEVVLHYLVRTDSDVIERWTTLTHTAAADAGDGGQDVTESQPFTVSRADSGSWLIPELPDYRCSAVSGAWAAENQLRRAPLLDGELTFTSRHGHTGHHANPWVMIDDGTATENQGEVWGVALAWSGTWRVTAQRGFEGRAAVTAGFGHDGVSWRLRPGEELVTPPVLGVYAKGGFGGASRAWHRHARLHILPEAGEVRPVLYNSWEAVLFDVDADSQLELARKAADLGAELFVVDDGWFGGRVNSEAGLGDWWPNPGRFPGGLGPVADEVHKLGMSFGIWVEPEMVNADSQLYQTHPDWVLHYPHRRRDELRTQLVLNFAREDVREWAFGWLDELVSGSGVDFLKWDMNRAFTQAGWPDADCGDQDRLWIDYARNVYAVIDRLRARHPGLRIESCAGGGGRVDFGILARTDQVWPSDNTGAFHRQSIQHGFSQLYPAGVMTAWVTDDRSVPLRYRFHVAMAGVLGVGGNLREWTAQECEEARGHIATYRQVRRTVQHGDQYRLGAEPGRGLSAVQYVHGDDVVLFVYHPHPAVRPAAGALRLEGLDPDARYAETGEPLVTGRVLMTAGLQVRDRLPRGDWASAVIRLRREG
jgi:alpha-galactosidase